MTRQERRWAVVLPAFNLMGWLVLWALRPPATYFLQDLENARARGELYGNSGAPWTTLGERALYNWSPWHGGELLLVKALEVSNLVPLLAAGFGTLVVTLPFGGYLTVYQVSWLRGGAFLVLATLQWSFVGRAIGSRVLVRQLKGAA